MKDFEYDSYRPLMRLEKGDHAIIRIKHGGLEKPAHRKKYGHIPDGYYDAVVTAPYELQCDQYPELGGKYCYWYGNKWGCGGLIFADEPGH